MNYYPQGGYAILALGAAALLVAVRALTAGSSATQQAGSVMSGQAHAAHH